MLKRTVLTSYVFSTVGFLKGSSDAAVAISPGGTGQTSGADMQKTVTAANAASAHTARRMRRNARIRLQVIGERWNAIAEVTSPRNPPADL